MDSDDKKITQLPLVTSLSDSDLFIIAIDVGTAPKTRAIEKSNAFANRSGWISVIDSWSYASANTITVPSGAAAIYKKGMGIRWKQGGGYKYAYITVVADTLLTVTGGTDYTVSNSAITDIAITFTPSSAIGFPAVFNCAAPTWDTATIDNGTGGQQPTAGSTFFRMIGEKIELTIALGSSGVVKNGAGKTITVSALPATLPNFGTSIIALSLGHGIFASVTTAPAVIYYVSSASFSMDYASSIADNASLAYTNCTILY